MSIIKSFSVGNGDMFYIDHNSSNFTIIDCYLSNDNKEEILNEISNKLKNKEIHRFVSTHPDEDHIQGLKDLDNKIGILNFYCVENLATKPVESDNFNYYCSLRDNTEKAFYLYKDCSRKWMNEEDENRGSSGISILWPNLNNTDYIDALNDAKEGIAYNNISPIIKYSIQNSATAIWMGDLEGDFMEKIKDEIDFPKVDILFAPHHGRDSGKIPTDVLTKLSPKVIVIGEAPSSYLNYYRGYNTITQNTAGDIVFDCREKEIDIYVGSSPYKESWLKNNYLPRKDSLYYIGSFAPHS